MLRIIAVASATVVATLVGAGPAAAASPPDSPECLGVVTAQRATAHHDIGEHASSQEEPRLGLGNVARALLGDDAHVGDLGAFLAEIDGDPATNCS
jgi:hypothetical protein